MKIPEQLKVCEYENELKKLIKDLKENKCKKDLIDKYNLPENIKFYIYI
jgi:hypothetical protein